ncbi:ferric reductase [Yoonia sp. R2331]|uniref:ferric reductase n=1 Tax=Yoonia sp. R2331 TaxID=3237238 RepID=UPI0034E5C01C
MAWRQPIYIAAGFAGIIGMTLLLVQPVLIAGHLPGFQGITGRRMHRVTGVLLLLAVLAHIAGLWITSPPDVIDVLLFASPTPFGVWGAIAMWAVFASALVALLRRKFRPKAWRRLHAGLAAVIVGGTVAHAVLIEGTMESMSKIALSAFIIMANLPVIYRAFVPRRA